MSADAFVAIDKSMILYQTVSKSGSLLLNGRISFFIVKLLKRSFYSGFK